MRGVKITRYLWLIAPAFRVSAPGWSTQATCEHRLPQRRGNHMVHHSCRKLFHTVNLWGTKNKPWSTSEKTPSRNNLSIISIQMILRPFFIMTSKFDSRLKASFLHCFIKIMSMCQNLLIGSERVVRVILLIRDHLHSNRKTGTWNRKTQEPRTVRGFESHGAWSQAAHQPRHEEMQVRDPGDADVWKTKRRHCELVAPLGVAAVWVEKELQLVACFKCHFLK